MPVQSEQQVTLPYSQTSSEPDLATVLMNLKNGKMTPEELLQDPAMAKYVAAAQKEIQKSQTTTKQQSANNTLGAKLLNNKNVGTRSVKASTITSAQTTNTENAATGFFSSLVSKPLGDKQDLDGKICNVVFDQIKAWSTKPGFQISIILTLVFFFYPLARLFVYIFA
jgi:hypothetical protein